MVAVNLWSSLSRLTGGAKVVEVEARTVAEVLDGLVTAHPALGPVIGGGVSVVVDGEVAAGRHAPVRPDSEVYLLQRLKGG